MAGLLLSMSKTVGEASRSVKSYLPQLNHSPNTAVHTYFNDHFAIALSLPDTEIPRLWGLDDKSTFLALFGNCYPDNSNASLSDASYIKQKAILENTFLNGIYNLVAWDQKSLTLSITNDLSGALSLYLKESDQRLLISSEPGLLLNNCPLDEIRPEAIKDLLKVGYLPSDTTISKRVKRLPASRQLKIKLKTTGFSKGYYPINFPDFKKQKNTFDQSFSTLFKDAVRIRMKRKKNHLLLTGGEDSRWILAKLAEMENGNSSKAFTLDACQNWDVRIAKEVANHCGIKQQVISIDPAKILERFTVLKNTISSTSDWHPGIFLPLLEKAGKGANLFSGFLGGTFSGAFIQKKFNPDFLHNLNGLPEQSQHLWQQNNHNKLEPGYDWQMEAMANLCGRQRRYINFWPRLGLNFGSVACPFSDLRLIQLSLMQTRDQVYLGSARRQIFTREFPDLAKIPNSNDGLSLKAVASRRLREKLSGTWVSHTARKLFPQTFPSFEVDALRPCILEIINCLPAEKKNFFSHKSKQIPIIPLFSMLSLVECHWNYMKQWKLKDLL